MLADTNMPVRGTSTCTLVPLSVQIHVCLLKITVDYLFVIICTAGAALVIKVFPLRTEATPG